MQLYDRMTDEFADAYFEIRDRWSWTDFDDFIRKNGPEKTPEEHWRTGDGAYLTPARLAHHALEAVEFYTGDSGVQVGKQIGRRLGGCDSRAATDQGAGRSITRRDDREDPFMADGAVRRRVHIPAGSLLLDRRHITEPRPLRPDALPPAPRRDKRGAEAAGTEEGQVADVLNARCSPANLL